MTTATLSTALLTFLVITLLTPSPTRAQHVELEVDPIAYALSGYSVHAAYAWNNMRIDAGVFGLEVPDAMNGNDGWSEKGHGVGVKWDYYFSDGTTGLFAGLEADYVSSTYTLKSSGASKEGGAYGVGVRTGYRFSFGETGLYLVPWVGLDYTTSEDVSLGESTFEVRNIRVFPTVHVGWRF